MNRLIGVVISPEQKKPAIQYQTQSASDFEFEHLPFAGDLPYDEAPVSPTLIVPDFRSSTPVSPTLTPHPNFNTENNGDFNSPCGFTTEEDTAPSGPDNVNPIFLRDISLSSSHYPTATSVKQLLAEEMSHKNATVYDDFYISERKQANEEKGDGSSRTFMGFVPINMFQKLYGADKSSAEKKGKRVKDNKCALRGLLKKVVPGYMYGAKEKQRMPLSYQRQVRNAPLTPRSPYPHTVKA